MLYMKYKVIKGLLGNCLHIKGGNWDEKNMFSLEVCSKITFFIFQDSFWDFKKQHRVLLC